MNDRDIDISFSTLACPDWSWNDLVTNGPRYGYDGVEIRLLRNEPDLLALPEFSSSELPNRRRELDSAGFAICGLASSVRFDEPGESARRKQLDIGRAYIDLAVELGISFVRVFGDVVPVDPEERAVAVRWIADGLQSLGETAATAGIEILIETHGDFSSSPLLLETLSLVDCTSVGVLWDTHHPWRFCGEPLPETFERLKPWVRHTHWKDSVVRPKRADDDAAHSAAGAAHSLMSGHRHADYVLFGGGEFPANECARLLIDANYTGWFSLEWEKAWHPELESPELALPLFPEKMRRLWQNELRLRSAE